MDGVPHSGEVKATGREGRETGTECWPITFSSRDRKWRKRRGSQAHSHAVMCCFQQGFTSKGFMTSPHCDWGPSVPGHSLRRDISHSNPRWPPALILSPRKKSCAASGMWWAVTTQWKDPTHSEGQSLYTFTSEPPLAPDFMNGKQCTSLLSIWLRVVVSFLLQTT